MAYEIEYGGISYKGEHDPFEVFCEIRWSIVDLLSAMDRRGIELTDDNIDKALDAVGYLHDRSVEDGWETMDILLSLEF